MLGGVEYKKSTGGGDDICEDDDDDPVDTLIFGILVISVVSDMVKSIGLIFARKKAC